MELRARVGLLRTKLARVLSLGAKATWVTCVLVYCLPTTKLEGLQWIESPPVFLGVSALALLGVVAMVASYVLSMRASLEEARVVVRRRVLSIDGVDTHIEDAVTFVSPSTGKRRVEARTTQGDVLIVDGLEEGAARAVVSWLGFGPGGARARYTLGNPARRFVNLLAGLIVYQGIGLFAVGAGLLFALLTPMATAFPWSAACLLLTVLAYAYAKRLVSAPEVTVGSDGVLITKLGKHTFVPLASITAARQQQIGAPIQLELSSGETVHIGGSFVSPQRRDALAQHIRSLLHFRSQTDAPVIAREGRSIAAWRDHLRGASGYRVAVASTDALADVLASPSASKEARIGAALALMGDPSAAPRVRVAADACADPATREALEAIAEERDDPIVLRALDP